MEEAFEKESVMKTPQIKNASPSNAENIVPSNSKNGNPSPRYLRRVLSSPLGSKSGSISRSSSSSNSIDQIIDRPVMRKMNHSGSLNDQSFLHVKKRQTLSPRSSDLNVAGISPRAIKELVLMRTPSPKMSPTESSKRRSADLADNSDSSDTILSPLSRTSTASALSAKALQMIEHSLSMSLPASPTADHATIHEPQSDSSRFMSRTTGNRNDQSEAGALITYTPHTDNEALVQLLQVGGTIGSSLAQVSNVVGTVLSEQAGRVIERTSMIVPLYSEIEMRSVQAKKNDLLNELSQLCVRLGQAEEREKEFAMRLMNDDYLKERVFELESNLDSFITENARLHSQLQSMSDDNSALLSHNLMHERERTTLLTTRAESLRENRALSVQVARLEEKLTASENHLGTVQQGLERERERFAREEFTWHQEMDRIAEEQHAMRAELESAFRNAVEQLEISEQKRDSVYAELTVLREIAESNKGTREKELTKLKDSMSALLELHKDQLNEKEVNVSHIKNLLSASDEKSRRLLSELEAEKTNVNSFQKEIDQLNDRNKMMLQTLSLLTNQKEDLAKHCAESESLFAKEKKLLMEQIDISKNRLQEVAEENDRLQREYCAVNFQISSQRQGFQDSIDNVHKKCSMLEREKSLCKKISLHLLH